MKLRRTQVDVRETCVILRRLCFEAMRLVSLSILLKYRLSDIRITYMVLLPYVNNPLETTEELMANQLNVT